MKYSKKDLLAAIDAVQNGVSVKRAALDHNVPRTTLSDKLHGVSRIDARKGPCSIFTPEEEAKLVNWIFTCSKTGFPINDEQLLISAGKYIEELSRENPFTNNTPGKKWLKLFLRRHPEVRLRTPQNLTISRACVTKETIVKWFIEVEAYLKENGYWEILEDPERVFNADEAAFFFNPKGTKVLCERGMKDVYNLISTNEKECLTVLMTINAAGKILPPTVIFKYVRVPKAILESVPSDWGVGVADSGWMTAKGFYEFMANIFNDWVEKQGIKRPVLFFVDGHKSHVTYQLSKFCEENKIILVTLPPNTTHIMQPLDVAVFRNLKRNWVQTTNDFRVLKQQPIIRKADFCPLLSQCIRGCLEPDTMKNGFKKCGLLPWSATAVDYSKIRSREETNLPSQQIQPMKPADAIQETVIAGQKTSSEENTSAHINEFQVALKKINEFLDEDKLEFFISCKNSPTWPELIKQEDTTLFLMWRHFWDKAEESAENNEVMNSETQSVTPSASISKEIEINPTSSYQSLSLDVPSLTSFFDEEDPAFRILATADAVLSDEYLGNILSPVLNNNPTLSSSPSANITSISAPSKEMQKVFQNIVDLPPQKNSIDAQSTPEHLSVRAQSTPENLSAKSPFIPQPGPSHVLENVPAGSTFISQPGPSHATSEVLNGTAPVGRDVIAVKTPTCDSTPKTSSTLNISPTIKRSANDTATSSLQSTPKKARLTFKTPTRKSPRKLLDEYSPSKRALMWPDNNEKSDKKRRSKETLPSIISSKKWQQIVEEKEKAKQDAEDEKKRRKEEREEKKKLKLVAAEEKKKNKQNKQKRKPSKKKTQKYCIEEEEDADVPDDEEAVGDEDDVLSDSGNSKTFKKEDYVIVIYEEEYFPGQITQIDETATVKTMKPAGIGIWKWPLRDDICEYEFSDIQTVIKPPVLCNKRGFYKVPEMSEYSEW